MEPAPLVIIYTEHNEQKNIIFTDLWDDDVSMCPFCRSIDDLCAYSQTDHVKECDCIFWCKVCKAIAVLLKDTIRKYSEEEMRVNFPEYNIDAIINHKDDPSGTEQFVVFDLAKILKVSNYDLHSYRITTSVDYTKYLDQLMIKDIISLLNEYAQFSDREVRQFIKYNTIEMGRTSNLEKRKKIMDRYSIVDWIHSDIQNTDVEPRFWNMSINVDSYNVEDPSIPYPIGFDLSYGGIYLLYVDSDGRQANMHY